MVYNFTIKLSILNRVSFWTVWKLDWKPFKKNALYLNVNVFSTKALIGDTFFTSPISDRTAIYVVICSQAKVQPLRPYLQFSVILP